MVKIIGTMRKTKVYQMVCIAGEGLIRNNGELPDGIDSFFELVQQYSRTVLPNITEEEVNKLVYNPLSEFLSLPANTKDTTTLAL